ncbi:Crp/Fnr family transcriptional regulator [Tardiphaga robiniae]|uniref:Crp/Fnr family transcriptional regulator n=1 Tax=Tardiphaga robiniae TaxID=943830 RepID=A0A163YFE3_9BRAD|nr:Crp/Fnr family transcriptional regulator [Tardiphaga robiniae]KZD22097.1 Crp/Fnr family transcriptional regulator [Tardiphaga robiniae]
MTRRAALKVPAPAEFDAPYFLTCPGIGKVTTDYKKNQNIFCQGETADSVCYILNGRIKLTVLSEQGKEAVVGLLEPGQFLGEGCLNGHPLRTVTTTAMEDCTIVTINKSVMLTHLRDEPAFAGFFVAYLLSRNNRIEEDLIDQLFNSSEKRLARLLLILAHYGEGGVSHPIDIDISQEMLAEMIGTTRSRVSFFMNKFRKLGFVSYDGHIQVHRSLLDAALNEKPHLQRGM